MKTMFACGLCCVLVGVGLAIAAEKCYQPSIHQKPCSNRPNMVSSCNTDRWSQTVCISKKLYTAPKDFPDGKTEAASGSTIEDKVECVKEYGCEWDEYVPCCIERVNWDSTPWDMENKIIVNHQVTCPPAG
ncbi:MAG TPA: hypothetical protein DEB39_14665 [Planctomycetaceae bacterium]|nr:hypothetical protein [Planctomycetaceae bacterium]